LAQESPIGVDLKMKPMTPLIPTVREGEKLFDLSLIEKFCRGNEVTREKMIRSFTSSIPLALVELHQAYLKKDFSKLQTTAHRIKPTLGFYAIVKIEKEIQRIESLAKECRSGEELEKALEKTSWVLQQVVSQMQDTYLIK